MVLPGADPGSDSTTLASLHLDLQAPLRGITEKTELLQRRILRADGLTSLERDLLLSTLGAVRGDLETIARRLAVAADGASAP